MSSTERPRSIPKALAFMTACATTTIWIVSLAIVSQISWLTPLAMLLELSLILFLLYRTLSALRLFNRHTKRLDILFYQDRKGSLLLILLSAIWALYVFTLGCLALLDILVPGGSWWGMKNPGVVGQLLQLFIVLGSPFVFIGIFGWLLTTAAKALWRISAPSERRDHSYREVPLVVSDDEAEDDGEWDGWKDNRGDGP